MVVSSSSLTRSSIVNEKDLANVYEDYDEWPSLSDPPSPSPATKPPVLAGRNEGRVPEREVAVTPFVHGQRVVVSMLLDAKAHQALFEPALTWHNFMQQFIGKVGVVMTVSGIYVTVRFFTWAEVEDRRTEQCKTRLVPRDLDWPTSSLLDANNLHFLTGDRVVIFNKKDHMSTRMRNIRVTGQAVTFLDGPVGRVASREATEDELLLPIYAGKFYKYIMRDRCAPQADRTPMRLLVGITTGTEIISTIRSWHLSNEADFARIIALHPDQVNAVVANKTPLMEAIEACHWPIVDALIAAGADRNVVDSNGNTLLHLAAKKGSADVVQGLLAFLPSATNRPNANGDTPLHIAVREQHPPCVDRLLAVPVAQINAQNKAGETALHLAVAGVEGPRQQAILSRLLSSFRLNLRVQNVDGATPLKLAIAAGLNKSSSMILSSKPAVLTSQDNHGLYPVHYAAIYARPQILDTILQMSNEVMRRSRTNRTALHYAAESWGETSIERDFERIACIQSLISAGVEVDVMDIEGDSALHILVRAMISQSVVAPTNSQVQSLFAVRSSQLALVDLAAKCRPAWPLAAACFIALQGAALQVSNRHGETPVSICEATHPQYCALLQHFSNCRSRSVRPMKMVGNNGVESYGVDVARRVASFALCTLLCEDGVANASFVPCGHRVACQNCLMRVPLKRCPVCYQLVTAAKNQDGRDVVLFGSVEERGVGVGEFAAAGSSPQLHPCGALGNDMTVSELEEKELAMRELRAKLEELENALLCPICFDARLQVVFQCGHQACANCAEQIILCHICRVSIERRTTIFN